MAKKERERKELKKGKNEKGRVGGKTIILFVIFGISLMPFILAPFENLFLQQNDYSIFNNGLKGTSIFAYRAVFESKNFPITLQSSLNSLYFMPAKNTILIETGPIQFFDPFEIITLINFVSNGGKLLLSSNFGTGSELTLLNYFMSDFFIDPLKETLFELFMNFTMTGFNISAMLDSPIFSDPNTLSSFILNELPQSSPKFSYWIYNNMYSAPIYDYNSSNNVLFLENTLMDELPYGMIIDDVQAPFNSSVNKLLLTNPTPLNLGIDFGIEGWLKLLPEEQKDPLYQAIEDMISNMTGLPFNISNTYEITSAMLELLSINYNISTTSLIAKTHPTTWIDANQNNFYDIMDYNGSFWIAALSANKRVIINTQPQMFTNLFYFSKEYDNAQFAMNLLNNLANNTPHFIVFDETKQKKAFPSFFGIFLKFINASTGILLLIPIFPLITYAMISKWVPKVEKPKIYKKSKIVKKRGRTLFSERMKWYKQKRQYNRAIRLLYRRLKRGIVNSIELKSYNPNKTIEIIKAIKPNVNISRFQRNLLRFERIEKNQIRITNQSSFLQVFNEMKWCYEQIK
ncbi:MAG: hypothetical protein ACTSRG_19485 [Candidatus Helarchaeota archaeon]